MPTVVHPSSGDFPHLPLTSALSPRARRQQGGKNPCAAVFHRFRPFSVGVEIEIRPRNQAADGFRRPRGRQKTVKTVKTDSERHCFDGSESRFFLEGGVPETRTHDRPMPMPSASPPSTAGGRLWTPVWSLEEIAAQSPTRRAA